MKLSSFLKIYISLVLLSFISCGDSVKETEDSSLKIAAITGDLSEFIKVVDAQYKINEYDEGILSLTIKSLKPMELEQAQRSFYEFKGKLLDGNGKMISESGDLMINHISYDSLVKFFSTKENELVINFESELDDDIDVDEHLSKVKSYKLSSNMMVKPNYLQMDKENEAANSDQTEIMDVPLSSVNADNVIDQYEDYVDRYVKLLEKADDETTPSLTAYSKLVEEGGVLSEKIEKIENTLTREQMARLQKITKKMTMMGLKEQ